MDNFSSKAELTSQSSLRNNSKAVKDDEAYNPFEHRNVEHPTSTLGSIAHLVKSCLGSGLLAMPAAFKSSGLAIGAAGTLLAGIICAHTMHILVKTSQEVCVDAKKPSLSYADTCGYAFSYGPKRLQAWGPTVKTTVDYSMTFAYLGVLCIYVVFIGSSYKEVIDVLCPRYILSIETYCVLTLVPLLLVCQIRNLKYLVPFSTVANALIIVVFVITMYYIFTDLPSPREREMVAGFTHWPMFFSTIIFAIEGVGVVMPVENEMANPKQFLGCLGVLNVSMVIVVPLYGLVGFFGYLQYGDTVKGSVTLNLPQDELIAQIAKLLMAVVIFLTYALLFYIPMDQITRMLEKRGTDTCNSVIQVTIRTGIVVFSVAVAAAFPNLELVISLVGAIFFSSLGLLFPAVIDTVFHWNRGLGPFKYVLWKNIIIGLISIVALVAGARSSIQKMVQEFSSSGLEVARDNSTFT